MTRRAIVALTLSALCAMAAAAIGRGVLDDAVAAARAEERRATMADVQAQLAASWGAQWRAMTAGADGEAVMQKPSAAATETNVPDRTAASPYRCADVPPAVMPEAVRAFCAEIDAAADTVGLDPRALAVLVTVECPWADPACGSHAGARGLAQIVPDTARTLAGQTGLPCNVGPTGVNLDVAVNLACGAAYFSQGLRAAASIWRAGDEASHVAAAGIGYNSGNGNVPKVVAHWQAGGHVCDAPVPAESRRWCRLAYDAWQLMTASPAVLDVGLGIAWRPRP